LTKVNEEAGMDPDRLRLATERVGEALRAVAKELGATEGELRAAIGFLAEVARAGQLGLLSDVLGVSVVVDDITHAADGQGTASAVEGPFYRAGAPWRTDIARPDEPGDVCFVAGQVADAATGAPLDGVTLDVWQAGPSGLYEHEDPDQPEYNLRGRLLSDEQGRYELRTVVPPPYEIPKGPVNRLLEAVGRNRVRPAHFHVKLSRDGYQPRTTMLYLEGGAHLDDDVISGVKPELVGRLDKHDDPDELRRRGLEAPFYTYTWDFTLLPAPGGGRHGWFD
jgi:protocatechuate 3,4-dioxygenase beta subunit